MLAQIGSKRGGMHAVGTLLLPTKSSLVTYKVTIIIYHIVGNFGESVIRMDWQILNLLNVSAST